MKEALRKTAEVSHRRFVLGLKFLLIQLLRFCFSLFSLLLSDFLVVCVKLFHVAGRFQVQKSVPGLELKISWFRLEEGLEFMLFLERFCPSEICQKLHSK